MPIGLTAEIGKGQNFEDFVWSCARQMGAFVHMRDCALDARLEMPQSDSWYEGRFLEAQRRLAEIDRMTLEEAEAASAQEYREACERQQKANQQKAELKQAYDQMLEKVCAWNPPTADHDGLKEFMIDQILRSIRSDCVAYPKPSKRESGHEWLKRRKEDARRDTRYYEKEWHDDIRRLRECRDWITALAESVPIPERMRPEKPL